MKNVRDFLEYLQANEMSFREGAVYFGDRVVCYMNIEDESDPFSPWTIWSYGDYSEGPDAIICERMRQVAWENVNPCATCGAGCDPGNTKVIFGKRFENVCNADMAFYSPEADALECVKRLLEMRKNA
ncbi:MAG: hypothetical protein LBE35_01760 [Clostridiales bacterium]|jgi:hypothetical protein|nr:hypothetical protein [Clostridiales bacterium]